MKKVPFKFRLVFHIQLFVEKFIFLIIRLFGSSLRSFLPKLEFQLRSRNEINTIKIDDLRIKPKENWVWIYCSSAGEFEQALPIIESHSNYRFLVIFHSKTGYNHVTSGHPYAHRCEYLLSEIYDSIFFQKLYSITYPSACFIIKHEFWAYFINFCNKNKINLTAIDVLFRENAGLLSILVKRTALYHCNHVQVVNEYSARQFCNSVINVDTKIEAIKLRISHISERRDRLHLFIPKDERKLLVIGSAFWADVEFLLAHFDQLSTIFKIIIVPHQIEQQKLKKIYEFLELKKILFSIQSNENKQVEWHDVLIFAVQGWLLDVYSYAAVCWVGGGFCEGVHNVLEPIMQCKVTYSGPNLNQQKEAIEALLEGKLKILPLTPQTIPLS